MPLYIRLDVGAKGKIFAWVSLNDTWNFASYVSAMSVPQLLRKLAGMVQRGETLPTYEAAREREK